MTRETNVDLCRSLLRSIMYEVSLPSNPLGYHKQHQNISTMSPTSSSRIVNRIESFIVVVYI